MGSGADLAPNRLLPMAHSLSVKNGDDVRRGVAPLGKTLFRGNLDAISPERGSFCVFG